MDYNPSPSGFPRLGKLNPIAARVGRAGFDFLLSSCRGFVISANQENNKSAIDHIVLHNGILLFVYSMCVLFLRIIPIVGQHISSPSGNLTTSVKYLMPINIGRLL